MVVKIGIMEEKKYFTDSRFERNNYNILPSEEEIWNKIVDSISFDFNLETKKSIISKIKIIPFNPNVASAIIKNVFILRHPL